MDMTAKEDAQFWAGTANILSQNKLSLGGTTGSRSISRDAGRVRPVSRDAGRVLAAKGEFHRRMSSSSDELEDELEEADTAFKPKELKEVDSLLASAPQAAQHKVQRLERPATAPANMQIAVQLQYRPKTSADRRAKLPPLVDRPHFPVPGSYAYLGGTGKQPGILMKDVNEKEKPVPILWAPSSMQYLRKKADERIKQLERLREHLVKDIEDEQTSYQRAKAALRVQHVEGAKFREAVEMAEERASLGDVDPTEDPRVVSLIETAELKELEARILEECANLDIYVAETEAEGNKVMDVYSLVMEEVRVSQQELKSLQVELSHKEVLFDADKWLLNLKVPWSWGWTAIEDSLRDLCERVSHHLGAGTSSYVMRRAPAGTSAGMDAADTAAPPVDYEHAPTDVEYFVTCPTDAYLKGTTVPLVGGSGWDRAVRARCFQDKKPLFIDDVAAISNAGEIFGRRRSSAMNRMESRRSVCLWRRATKTPRSDAGGDEAEADEGERGGGLEEGAQEVLRADRADREMSPGPRCRESIMSASLSASFRSTDSVPEESVAIVPVQEASLDALRADRYRESKMSHTSFRSADSVPEESVAIVPVEEASPDALWADRFRERKLSHTSFRSTDSVPEESVAIVPVEEGAQEVLQADRADRYRESIMSRTSFRSTDSVPEESVAIVPVDEAAPGALHALQVDIERSSLERCWSQEEPKASPALAWHEQEEVEDKLAASSGESISGTQLHLEKLTSLASPGAKLVRQMARRRASIRMSGLMSGSFNSSDTDGLNLDLEQEKPREPSGSFMAIPLFTHRSIHAVAAVLCVHTLGRPSLFCKLTETERESITRAAAAAERALLNVQRHGGLQPTAGRQGSHDPMADMKCGVAGWAGVVLGIVNTAQRESFILTLLEMHTLIALLEGLCLTPSSTRRLLLCKLFLAVFAMSDFGGDPDNKSNTVGIMDWLGKLRSGALSSDPLIQQETWEIVINNIALRPTSGKTKTIHMWMRSAPIVDRPATKYVFHQVQQFAEELLEGVTYSQAMAVSTVAALLWEWINCRFSRNTMYNDKAVYENGFFEDRTCKPEEMENCFNPLRCLELTALLEQPVEDDNVKAMLDRCTSGDLEDGRPTSEESRGRLATSDSFAFYGRPSCPLSRMTPSLTPEAVLNKFVGTTTCESPSTPQQSVATPAHCQEGSSLSPKSPRGRAKYQNSNLQKLVVDTSCSEAWEATTIAMEMPSPNFRRRNAVLSKTPAELQDILDTVDRAVLLDSVIATKEIEPSCGFPVKVGEKVISSKPEAALWGFSTNMSLWDNLEA